MQEYDWKDRTPVENGFVYQNHYTLDIFCTLSYNEHSTRKRSAKPNFSYFYENKGKPIQFSTIFATRN